MNKKLLLTVLAAGLVFPTATASANTYTTTLPDGTKVEAPFKDGQVVLPGGEKVEYNGGHNLISDLGDQNLNKDLNKQVEADKKAKEEADKLAAQDKALKDKLKASTDLTPTTTATSGAATTTKAVTTTKAPTTTVKGGNKGPVTKPAVQKAVASAKAKASSAKKAGAKTLPKTSATK